MLCADSKAYITHASSLLSADALAAVLYSLRLVATQHGRAGK
jgi:hypothetical protein